MIRFLLLFSFLFVLVVPGKNQNKFLLFVNDGSISSNAAKLDEQTYFPYIGSVFVSAFFYIFKNRVRFGEFNIPKEANLLDLVGVVMYGKRFQRKVHFIDGKTTKEIIEQIKELPGLKGAVDQKYNQEGIFLTDTYTYYFGDYKNELLKHMQDRLSVLLRKLHEEYGLQDMIKNPREAVILASIVSNEGDASEHKKIAAVFLKRLSKKIRLQSDVAINYIRKISGENIGKVFYKDLHNDSAYNTYKYEGLPPGPVGNVSKSSLESVFNPDSNEYMYFVADENGKHLFSRTFKEHVIKKYNVKRAGKFKK